MAVAVAREHHAFVALSLLAGLLPALILISIVLRSPAGGTPATGIAVVLCGIAMFESFGVRAQVLGWGAFAAFMLFVERKDRWYYAVIPCTVVWANLHASVMIAPIVVLTRLLAAVLAGGPKALRHNRDLLLLPAILLATLCTPLGWRLPVFAVDFVHSPIRHYIQEWQPPTLSDASFLAGVLPLAIAIAAGWKRLLRREFAGVLLSAVLFAAVISAQRNAALFAIAASPTAAGALAARFPSLTQIDVRIASFGRAALTLAVIAIVVAAIAMPRVRPFEDSLLPLSSIASLARDGHEHRLFCENFTWCSVALQYPRVRVFLDGRCDAYPLPIWLAYAAAIRTTKPWQGRLQRYGVDSILAGRGSRLASALASNRAWKLLFSDGSFVLFRRA